MHASFPDTDPHLSETPVRRSWAIFGLPGLIAEIPDLRPPEQHPSGMTCLGLAFPESVLGASDRLVHAASGNIGATIFCGLSQPAQEEVAEGLA